MASFAAGSTVVLVPNAAAPRLDLYKVAATDSSARFQIRGIAPLDYDVFAWEDVDSGAWLENKFLNLFRDRAIVIRVTDRAAITVTLQAN